MKKRICTVILLVIVCVSLTGSTPVVAAKQDTVPKWVDFNASAEIMNRVYEVHRKTKQEEIHYDFVSTLAYLATKNGNKFNLKRDNQELSKLLKTGKHPNQLYEGNKYYAYYLECYNAIFAGYFFNFEQNGELKHGLVCYYPLAYGYGCSDGDDFGNSRSYGFKRKHLGHDMFGSVGTPIVAVEGGRVTELGWNRYGGWRVGIRSHDGKRFYYYAHLRKNRPFADGLEKGSVIKSGEVIGYMGVTGYSTKENTNMNSRPHLHFGLQLIFHQSQEDGNGEIWIDVYQLVRFLKRNRASVSRTENGGFISHSLRTPVA